MGWIIALILMLTVIIWPTYEKGEISVGLEMWRRKFRIFKNKKD
jgi:hypothetical protein